jgi:hypothetical protein
MTVKCDAFLSVGDVKVSKKFTPQNFVGEKHMNNTGYAYGHKCFWYTIFY